MAGSVNYSSGPDFITRMGAPAIHSRRSARPIIPVYAAVPRATVPPPSEHELHPYTLMDIRSSPVLRACAACSTNSYIFTMRKRLGVPLRLPPRGSAPSGSVCFIPLGTSSRADADGELVNDIIAFAPGYIADELCTLPVRHPAGPLHITLKIEGHPPVDDVVYGSCVHRDITAEDFVWWVAHHMRVLAEWGFRRDSDNLELLWLHSGDEGHWTVQGRFRD
ncbi:hypothetical protein B0H15DRAFT_953138 [Mycena belliarum]|uniref:Uncharacterized protein n=1 Tax=Mycena belliarum TaxID=1033014 RepID=A0AAD6TXI5_9AGAR|nr:hypothetical protein B0H15DRAFT_953138 [Mycena belliae]